MPYFPSMESPGETLIAKYLRYDQHHGSELTISYPRGIFLQRTSPKMIPFMMLSLEMFLDIVGMMSRDLRR
jgi:hypothetical protein